MSRNISNSSGWLVTKWWLSFMYPGKTLEYTRVTWNETWVTFVVTKMREERINWKSFKSGQILAKNFLVIKYFTKYFVSFLWTTFMLTIFYRSGKTPWLSEDLKIWARARVIESPHNWIMKTEMLSNPSAFLGFNELITEVISSFLMETVFKRK